MKVFVTGGSGFTGGHLCRRLARDGYDVVALARKSSDVSGIQNMPGINIIYGDLTEKDSFVGALKSCQRVYHIGALYRQANLPNSQFYKVNVQGTKNLLEASFECNVKRFIHCSTVGVQGHIVNPPATEDVAYKPGDHYQKSKVEGEKLALNFFREYNLPGVVFRPVGIYGPGDTRFLKLFKSIRSGSFVMFGNGQVLFHLIYINDLIDGIILCGDKEEALGGVFTLGGPEYVTLEELVGTIADILEVKKPRLRIPFWPLWFMAVACEFISKPFRLTPPIYRRRIDFFRKNRAFDISRAREKLGFNPKVGLIEGIRLTAQWYKSQGMLK